VILYEVLAGRSPFPGAPGAAPPEPLRNLRRDLPSELTDAVMACLESDPDWRPKDLSYVLQVLRRLRGTPQPAAPARAAARAPAEARPRAEIPRARARKKPGKPPLLLITVVATALIVGGVVWWLSSGPGAQKTTTGPRPPATPRTATQAGLGTTAAATPTATPPPAPTPTPAAFASLMTPTPLPIANRTPPPAVVPTPPPAVATPFPTPTARPATPTPLPPTPPPTPTPRPATPTPPPATPVPTPTPAARTTAPDVAVTGPILLKSLAPPVMARGTTNFYDLHGTGLRPELTAVLLRGRDVVSGIAVVKQVYVNPTLVRVVVRVDQSVSPGSYTLTLVDSHGSASNGVSFKIN
jgi:hypothetical protein